MKQPVVVGVLSLVLAATASIAHDTWLVPRSFAVAAGATVELGLSSGMTFPQDDHAVEADRLATASCRVGGETVALEASPGEHALRLSARLDQRGVAACVVETRPRTLELAADDVEHYFAEADIAEPVRRSWEAMPEPKRWRESYAKHAKAFVRVGDTASTDVGWAPLGADLELSPAADPETIAAGSDALFVLMRRGAPYPGLVVSAVSEKGGEPLRSTADADGLVTFRFPAAGRWLLRAVDVQPSELPDLEWQSHFATLTLEVRARR